MINRCKYGICHCGECPTNQEVAGRKPAKTFMCLRTYNAMKAKEQMDKANEKNKIRMLTIGNQKSSYRPADDKLVDNAAAKRLRELKKFFDECAIEIDKNPHCDNCGEYISPNDYKNSTGHILPKGIFHSIETHPLCWVKVGNRCNCHNDTHRLDKFSKMPIFTKAVKQFRQIEHLITEKHKLLDEFRMYAAAVPK